MKRAIRKQSVEDERDFNKIETILTKAEEVLKEWKAVQPDYDRLRGVLRQQTMA